MKILADLQASLKGSDGEGRGLKDYEFSVEEIKSKWANGSRQKRRDEWVKQNASNP